MKAAFLTISLIAFTALTPAVHAQTKDPAEIDSLACEVYREREAWFTAMRTTEARWGLPIEHQLALLAEDWDLEHGHVPSRWLPDWTRPTPSMPGIAPGYFDATWKQYAAQTASHRPSPKKFRDVVDFMGWYFALLGPADNVSPYDPVAQYILWRHGPDVYRAGEWQRNLWMKSQAERYAARVRLFSDDLVQCKQVESHWQDRLKLRSFGKGLHRFIFSEEQDWDKAE